MKRCAWTVALVALVALVAPAVASAQSPSVDPGRAVYLDAEAGVEATGRHMDYTDDLFHRLRTYDLTAAPGFFARAEFYPGALTDNRYAAMVGVVAGADYLVAPASRDDRGNDYGIRAWGYTTGLRVRLPRPYPDVGIDLAYVAQRFTVGDSNPGRDGGIPNVGHQSLRVGASGRMELGRRVAVLAHAAYLAVLSTGTAQGAYFPRESAGAVEAGVGVAVGFGPGLEIRAALDYRRYFYAMNPQPGDPYIVGGALDQFVTGSIALALRR